MSSTLYAEPDLAPDGGEDWGAETTADKHQWDEWDAPSMDNRYNPRACPSTDPHTQEPGEPYRAPVVVISWGLMVGTCGGEGGEA